MPVRPERLWDQYVGTARAELLRGCGYWPAQPHPCRLEPPFDAFESRRLTVWDCHVNHWEAPYEGNVLAGAINIGQPVHPAGQPVLLPSVVFPDGDQLQVITVDQFPDDETTLPMADQLLRSLLAVRRPVAFELVGIGAQKKWDSKKAAAIVKSGGSWRDAIADACLGWTEPATTIQFTVHRADVALLRQQLLLHYPNSAVVVGRTRFDDLPARLRWDETSCGATLALNGLYVFPIRTYRQLSPDVLAVAVAAMDALGADDWAILQILFSPARGAWAENAFAALTNPCDPNAHFLESDDIHQAKAKFQSPLFSVSIRLAASHRNVFQQLLGWAGQFSNPPRQRFELNDVDWENGSPTGVERGWLDQSMEYRCTSRPGMLLNTEELAGLVHLPGAHIASERLRRAKSRTRPARYAASPRGGILLGTNVHRGETRPAGIPAEVRPWHCYVAGATGTGKSTLLLNMLLQDIQAGAGVGVLDPHGDLIRDVLAHVPRDRIKDVVYFNPADIAFPPALNIVQANGRLERESLVSETVTTLHRFFPDAWGPRLEHILLHTLTTVSMIRGGTLRDVRRMLTDANFRFRVVSKLNDPDLIEFWNDEFPQLPRGSTDPVLNKLSPFLMKTTVRNIVCQPETLINFDDVLNRRRIFLANLSFGLLGEAVAGTLGTFLMAKLLGATFRRAALPRDRRPPFFLYVDEFQNFLNLGRGFDKILSEARKFGLVLAGMANQYVRQLTPEVRAAIAGNVGSVVTFRLGLDDARLMAHDLRGFTAEEIMSLGRGEAFARVGSSEHVFNLATYPPPKPPNDDPTADIIASCRRQFARPRAEVERRFKPPANDTRSSKPATPPRSGQNENRTSPPASKAPATAPPPPEVTPADLDDFVT